MRTYRRGNAALSVEQVDGFGKNPGLWIGTVKPSSMTKVASFGSKDKAEVFCKWLDYICGGDDDEEALKQLKNSDYCPLPEPPEEEKNA